MLSQSVTAWSYVSRCLLNQLIAQGQARWPCTCWSVNYNVSYTDDVIFSLRLSTSICSCLISAHNLCPRSPRHSHCSHIKPLPHFTNCLTAYMLQRCSLDRKLQFERRDPAESFYHSIGGKAFCMFQYNYITKEQMYCSGTVNSYIAFPAFVRRKRDTNDIQRNINFCTSAIVLSKLMLSKLGNAYISQKMFQLRQLFTDLIVESTFSPSKSPNTRTSILSDCKQRRPVNASNTQPGAQERRPNGQVGQLPYQLWDC